MNDDKPESIWKKSWHGPGGWLLAWFALTITTAIIFFVIMAAIKTPITRDELMLLLILEIVLTFVILSVLLIRWLCCWKNFRRFLFACACLATLMALFYAEEDWRGKHDWEKFKRQWEAQGEHFSFANFIPSPVPDNQNFAMAPIWVESMKAALGGNSFKWFPDIGKNGWTNFANRLDMEVYADNDPYSPSAEDRARFGNWQKCETTDLKPWQHYYRTLAARTNLFSIAPRPQTPARDVLLALSRYDPAIEELRNASRRPYSRFPLDYDNEDPAEILLPHLADLKRCSQVIQLRAIAELQNGQTDAALADVELALRLVNSIRTEPFIISQLVRLAIFQIAVQPIYEGLGEHKWSDRQLTELEGALSHLDFLAAYELSVRGERAAHVKVIEYLEQKRGRFNEMLPMMSNDSDRQKQMNRFGVFVGIYLAPKGWFYRNDIQMAELIQQTDLPVVNDQQQTVSPGKAALADTAFASLDRLTPFNFLVRFLTPYLSPFARKAAYGQNAVNLTRVAVALERFRLVHREYPASLDALAPRFIARLPHDVIDGQPLHYRQTADGLFILYSIGWNETDDGGVVGYAEKTSPTDESPSRVDISQGDWVWRYPQN